MKILIAEDDAISRRLLETILRKWGYDVVVAQDGGQAWTELQKEDAPRLAIPAGSWAQQPVRRAETVNSGGSFDSPMPNSPPARS